MSYATSSAPASETTEEAAVRSDRLFGRMSSEGVEDGEEKEQVR